jgi:glutaredoxin
MASSSSSPDAVRDELLGREKLLVVGKSYCPYTQRARKALSEAGVKPANLDLDLMKDGDALQARKPRTSAARQR